MGREVTASTEAILPISVEETWAVLSDTPRMVALDPLIDSYEPESRLSHKPTDVSALDR